MNYLEILKAGKENLLESIYLVVNREPYLYDHTLEALASRVVAEGMEAFNHGIFDLEETTLQQVMDFLNTPVLMGGKKLAVVHHLEGLNPDEDSLKALVKAAEGQLLLLVFPNKMSKTFKQLQKEAVPLVAFEKLDPREFRRWVIKRFKGLDKKLSNQSLDFFVQYSFYNDRDQRISLYHMENEIRKIASIGKEIIEIEDLKELMVMPLEVNLFALTDSLFEKDLSNTLKILDDLFQKGHTAYEIFPLLSKQYHNMVIARALGDQGLPYKVQQEILGFKSDYPVKMIHQRMGSTTKKKLLRAYETCLVYEMKAKQQKLNPRAHLESLLFDLKH
jgi:DNA polymerase III delta subunit